MPYINPGDANGVLEKLLDEKAGALEKTLDADVLTICAPIWDGLEEFVRTCIESIDPRRERLAVVLETGGGLIEVVDRIVQTLRHHYPKHVEFIVPNFAMSAGTVLAMSGDAILMDYFSVLGPIDPQVESRTSRRLIPARGYLDEYEKLVKKSADGTMTNAELAFFVQKFDPAELYAFQHAVDLSISLLKEWLTKYKFKNWTQTQERRLDVTPEMRAERAVEVAKKLGDVEMWHSHGRGIPMAALRSLVNVQIDDFGAKEPLNANITDYYGLLTDFQRKNGHGGMVHVRGTMIPMEQIK